MLSFAPAAGAAMRARMNDKQCLADTIIFLDAPIPSNSHWNGTRDANRRKGEGEKEKKEVWLEAVLQIPQRILY